MSKIAKQIQNLKNHPDKIFEAAEENYGDSPFHVMYVTVLKEFPWFIKAIELHAFQAIIGL